MPSNLLSDKEHRLLLEKANKLSFDNEAKICGENLEELFQRYHDQIRELFGTIAAYEATANRIRLRQCLKDN